MNIPDPDLDFYPSRIPDPGSRIQGSKRQRIPGPGSRIWIRNTVIDRGKRYCRQMKKMFSIQKHEEKLTGEEHAQRKRVGPINQRYIFILCGRIISNFQARIKRKVFSFIYLLENVKSEKI
jgi:hypothetical protein